MSVLIKGKMPEKCFQCVAYDIGSTSCLLFSNGIPARYRLSAREKPDWCELVELPPHGDLISKEQLVDIGLHLMNIAKNDDIANGVKWLWQYVIEAPTILEAEEEES